MELGFDHCQCKNDVFVQLSKYWIQQNLKMQILIMRIFTLTLAVGPNKGSHKPCWGVMHTELQVPQRHAQKA